MSLSCAIKCDVSGNSDEYSGEEVVASLGNGKKLLDSFIQKLNGSQIFRMFFSEMKNTISLKQYEKSLGIFYIESSDGLLTIYKVFTPSLIKTNDKTRGVSQVISQTDINQYKKIFTDDLIFNLITDPLICNKYIDAYIKSKIMCNLQLNSYRQLTFLENNFLSNEDAIKFNRNNLLIDGSVSRYEIFMLIYYFSLLAIKEKSSFYFFFGFDEYSNECDFSNFKYDFSQISTIKGNLNRFFQESNKMTLPKYERDIQNEKKDGLNLTSIEKNKETIDLVNKLIQSDADLINSLVSVGDYLSRKSSWLKSRQSSDYEKIIDSIIQKSLGNLEILTDYKHNFIKRKS